MCLYPRLIQNKKYVTNKKNGGVLPYCQDYRIRTVPIGCGNCIECRQQKARQWQVRLNEELKSDKNAQFVTLTFAPEYLEQLMHEADTDDLNNIATYAIRHFLERYRKQNKKSLKHWLITELGEENTERIHIHGLIWRQTPFTIEELTKFWKYGRTDNGKYVNEKTINYIIKYVTKIDPVHKDFVGKIHCTAGLGKGYIGIRSKANEYRPNNTREYYTLPNGNRVNMPIYYRNKIYSEDEREKLWIEKLNKKEIYVRGIKCKVDTEEHREAYLRVLKTQQEVNEQAGYGKVKEKHEREKYKVTLEMLNKATQKGQSLKGSE